MCDDICLHRGCCNFVRLSCHVDLHSIRKKISENIGERIFITSAKMKKKMSLFYKMLYYLFLYKILMVIMIGEVITKGFAIRHDMSIVHVFFL